MISNEKNLEHFIPVVVAIDHICVQILHYILYVSIYISVWTAATDV